MIDKNILKILKNLLELNNKNVDLHSLYSILSAIDSGDTLSLLKNILRLSNSNVDVKLLENVFSVISDHPELEKDILDSFSTNQFKSKNALLDAIDKLGIINTDSTVVIWGCWYGSILIPLLSQKVKNIIGIDLDETVLKIAKNTLFNNIDNVDFIVDDVFKTYRDIYLNTDLIINTSCEHMKPMNEWPWFQKGALLADSERFHVFGSHKLSSNCHFAFQSNNMFDIQGHINCVNTLEEFKQQLPKRASLLYEEEIIDTRGSRYLLIGKFDSI